MISRKKVEIVGEHQIKYLTLPWWMLYSGSEATVRWSECQLVTHTATKTVIILMASNYSRQEARYTIYHEYIEGCCKLKIGIAKSKELLEAAVIAAYDETGLRRHPFQGRAQQYLNRTKDWEHVIALLLELQLIKEELGEETFKKALDHSLSHRLGRC